MTFVIEPEDSRTVTKAETRKIVATPIRYEDYFFVCVRITLCRMVIKLLNAPEHLP